MHKSTSFNTCTVPKTATKWIFSRQVQSYDNAKILLKLTFDDQLDGVGRVFPFNVIGRAGVVPAVSPPYALNHQVFTARQYLNPASRRVTLIDFEAVVHPDHFVRRRIGLDHAVQVDVVALGQVVAVDIPTEFQ